MQVGIVTKDRVIRTNRSVPSPFVQRPENVAKGRKWFKLDQGTIDLDDTEGTEVHITGTEYIVGKRRYPLQGYAVLARLTPDFRLVPHLRIAVGREIQLVKDESGGSAFWPVIVQNPDIRMSSSPPPPVVEEALNAGRISETADLNPMAEAMVSSEPPSGSLDDSPFDDEW
jgi:hypothetical protein